MYSVLRTAADLRRCSSWYRPIQSHLAATFLGGRFEQYIVWIARYPSLNGRRFGAGRRIRLGSGYARCRGGGSEAGATKILVADSHGNGESLLIDEFPRDVHIIRSWPRHGGMMAGIDSTFNAAIFIGYHASASSSAGVRAHTISSATFTRIAINGQDVSEGELAAAQAGAVGVPVVFMSGDNVATAELRARIGNIVTVETKKALSFHSAETITPAESVARIEAGVRSALSHVHDFEPYVVTTPVTVEMSYKNYAAAEIFSYLPGMERVGSRTVKFVGKNITDAVDVIMVAESYQPDVSP